MRPNGRTVRPDDPEDERVHGEQQAERRRDEHDEVIPGVERGARRVGAHHELAVGELDRLLGGRRRDQPLEPVRRVAAGLVRRGGERYSSVALGVVERDVVGAHAPHALQEGEHRRRTAAPRSSQTVRLSICAATRLAASVSSATDSRMLRNCSAITADANSKVSSPITRLIFRRSDMAVAPSGGPVWGPLRTARKRSLRSGLRAQGRGRAVPCPGLEPSPACACGEGALRCSLPRGPWLRCRRAAPLDAVAPPHGNCSQSVHGGHAGASRPRATALLAAAHALRQGPPARGPCGHSVVPHRTLEYERPPPARPRAGGARERMGAAEQRSAARGSPAYPPGRREP